jgi:hypothetical protein
MIVSETQTNVLQPEKTQPPIRYQKEALSPYIIFSVLLIPRLLAAQYSIIGDCDEGIQYHVESIIDN